MPLPGSGLLLPLVLLAASLSPVASQLDDQGSVSLSQRDYSPASAFRSRTLPANGNVHCVTYYARLTGPGDGALDATLVEPNRLRNISQLGMFVNRVQGQKPSLGYFEIPEQTQKYQVLIKAVGKNVEILQAKVRSGPCLEIFGSCDFEKDVCGYNLRNKRWVRSTPSNNTGDREGYPGVDATLNSDKGHLLSTTVTRDYENGQFVELVSPDIESTQACLRFRYTIYGHGELAVSNEQSEEVYRIFTNSDSSGNSAQPTMGFNSSDNSENSAQPIWQFAEIDIKEGEPFRLTFTAYVLSTSEMSKIALDDIKVMRQSCGYSPQPILPQRVPVTNEASCSFDNDCTSNWTSVKGRVPSGWKWVLRNGVSKRRLPNYDHTSGDPKGYFMYVFVWKKFSMTETKVTGPAFDRRHNATGPNCFSFWYMMHGAQVPKLSAYFKWPGSRSYGWALWSREGDQGPGWKQAFVQTNHPWKNNKGHIEFGVINSATGSVAVDDVKVYDGPCPDLDHVCDFEKKDICGFDSPTRVWRRRKASAVAKLTGLAADHSTNTPSGHFMFINERSKFSPQFGLKSPLYPPTSGRCVKFYYSVADNAGTIAMDVALQTESKNAFTIAEMPAARAQGRWSLAEINAVSRENFQIVFLARPDGGTIGIDDFQVSRFPCEESYGCDFEDDFCSWSTNMDDPDNLDWQITSGKLLKNDESFTRDVTMNNQFGHFLYLPTSKRAESGDVAVLTSQEMPLASCLMFHYSMLPHGNASLAVNVTAVEGDSPPETIWTKTGNDGVSPTWTRAEVDIREASIFKKVVKKFQLSLIGAVDSPLGADIAVDDINVYLDNCSDVKEKEKTMFSCPSSRRTQKIQRSQLCDSIADCEGGEDEENCADCEGGEDEENCEQEQKPDKERKKFMVKCSKSETGQMIHESQVCDSVAHCEGGEDEEDCDTLSTGTILRADLHLGIFLGQAVVAWVVAANV
ncbi:hypothetical protein RRG08_044531 [Elysia crispata]|uniref:MAM domain-containing protein n=1 Tax=Elysia crispata TaxID=231223 RepID=A0AAE0ZBI3_9GAST|nr:hypothetical protein RRG08_044531 [Elysia crispata]KAK3766343.1 hypothetical protein RRG08_044531 [Elysia crispata]